MTALENKLKKTKIEKEDAIELYHIEKNKNIKLTK